jgi:formate dehydrogenase subunit delta
MSSGAKEQVVTEAAYAGGDPAAHLSSDKLIQMANDIGSFFRAEPNREDALEGISGHINRFWTRRMRQRLLQLVADGGAGLDELPRAAMERVQVAPATVPAQPG